MVPISDDPSRWDPGSRLRRSDGSELTVESSRSHKGSRLLVKFEGVSSRSEAERLSGPVYVTSDQRRELDEGQYWQNDLIGCVVVTRDGAEVGEVSGIVSGAAQDLMSVAAAERSWLVPLVTAIVLDVDVEARRVVIDPPPGLLE
jgi:16S rRNA processing protein RimM